MRQKKTDPRKFAFWKVKLSFIKSEKKIKRFSKNTNKTAFPYTHSQKIKKSTQKQQQKHTTEFTFAYQQRVLDFLAAYKYKIKAEDYITAITKSIMSKEYNCCKMLLEYFPQITGYAIATDLVFASIISGCEQLFKDYIKEIPQIVNNLMQIFALPKNTIINTHINSIKVLVRQLTENGEAINNNHNNDNNNNNINVNNNSLLIPAIFILASHRTRSEFQSLSHTEDAQLTQICFQIFKYALYQNNELK